MFCGVYTHDHMITIKNMRHQRQTERDLWSVAFALQNNIYIYVSYNSDGETFVVFWKTISAG